MVIINLDVSNMNERRNFYRELGREVLHDPRRGGQCADTKSREPQLRSLAQDLARGDQKLRATHREGDKTLIINKGEGIHGLETCRGSPRSQGEHDDDRCRDGRWEHPEATSLIHEVVEVLVKFSATELDHADAKLRPPSEGVLLGISGWAA